MPAVIPRNALAAACALWFVVALPACRPASEPTVVCHAGAYRLHDGTVVAVSPTSDPDRLRWRLLDGRTGRLTPDARGEWTSTLGWSDRTDGVRVRFGECAAGRIVFDGRAGNRLAFDVTDTTFAGAGVTLKGRLVLPKGAGPVPIVVQVHGSEDYSAVVFNHQQQWLPAHGIGVFVYDKRGTGDSSGRYSQDFSLLADDAQAAMREARRLAGPRAGRVGFGGGSQAGWVAPLAASRTAADFVAVGYGLADGPLAEDRDQVMLDLVAAGHGPDVLAKAREVTDATGAVIASGFKRGFDRLDAVRVRYGHEPWWKDLRGEFTGELIKYPALALRVVGPLRGSDTSWNYDPMPTLRGLPMPQLWVLAGADRKAPPVETRRRLLALAAAGRPITVVEFPQTDHGIHQFETGADGTRVETRIADGYFRLLIDWIKHGRLDGVPYGTAQLLAEPAASPNSR
ncbi:alpha/beta hydrolase family protein [Lysobacter cavernae]|uniref:Alpha/beta hydrolase family protein n=1 Tax=Lysobacter cavernae TaxID=1685901 RepID=A0ABV7RUT2_9GAMM